MADFRNLGHTVYMKRRIILLITGLIILNGAVTDAYALTLTQIVRGRILLDVENRGEAWYVYPLTGRRYFLGRPEDALRVMRDLGLGITNRDLDGIPKSFDSSTGNIALKQRLSGRILLQVEARGEAWYVNPVNLRRYYLGRPEDALKAMRELSLGITSANLSRIPAATHPPVLLQLVPFLAQAPTGEWSDPRQQEGCEEASALMAVAWARNETLSNTEGRQTIIDMSDWEMEQYGYYYDTSIQDTADRIFRRYLNYDKISTRFYINTDDIKAELGFGNIVLVAINGQTIENPYYRGAGPLRHMFAVVGYDASTDEFIVHDPGTSYGASMRFSKNALQNSLRDYPSGTHEPLDGRPTAMLVVSK